jgi:HNH endonuclease
MPEKYSPAPCSHEEIKNIFDYDPAGHLVWKQYRTGCAKAGYRAGTRLPPGYIQIRLYKKSYRAHRLIWYWHTGNWPAVEIDHINRVKDDNRIENLREVDGFQQMQNRPVLKNNTSGYEGVYPSGKAGTRWKATIRYKGKFIHIGTYSNKEDAHAAYMAEKRRLFDLIPDR